METQWRRIAPAVPVVAVPVDCQLYEVHDRGDQRRARLFEIRAVLAIVVGCIGLYGLAAFDTACVEEIGIRTALGASTGEVLRLLIGSSGDPCWSPTLSRCPSPNVAMQQWLAEFDDRVALSQSLFAGGAMLAAGIAVATTLLQAWRVALGPSGRHIATIRVHRAVRSLSTHHWTTSSKVAQRIEIRQQRCR